MRLLGMLLALAAIVWVMYQSSGGGKSDTVITESQQQALKKAQNLEGALQATADSRLQEADQE